MNARAQPNTEGPRTPAPKKRRFQGILSAQPEDLIHGTGWRAIWAVLREAILRLWDDEAMPLAGNIAFRAVMAIFPFLIFVSSLTAYVGDRAMADELNEFLIAITPSPLVQPLVSEVHAVLTVRRGGILSIGVLLTIWFAIGGVDGVRVALNRAYNIRECRPVWTLYAVQTLMVVCLALVLVVVGYLLVLAPLASNALREYLPGYQQATFTLEMVRVPASAAILTVSLFAAHTFLPARRTRFSNMWPGVVCTVAAWMILASIFSFYLTNFADYASYYAGLAGVMAALFFIYLASLVLIFGGEINRAMRIRRLARVLRPHHEGGAEAPREAVATGA